MLATLIYARRQGLSFWLLTDIMVLAGPVVELLARVRTAAEDKTVLLWEVPAPAPGTAERALLWAQVISGMEVAQKLSPRDPAEGFDLPPGDVISSVEIEEK